MATRLDLLLCSDYLYLSPTQAVGHTFYRVEGSLACVSMAGSLLILISGIFVKSLRHHPTNLVLFLAFSDFMFSAKFALTAVIPGSESLQDDNAICLTQAIWAQVRVVTGLSPLCLLSFSLLLVSVLWPCFS